jgi:hypothetical protein
MRVTLVSDFGWDFRLVADDGEAVAVYDIDYDQPALAKDLGIWSPCPCGETDGTVDCPHKTGSEMICEAGDALFQHIGEEFDYDD